MLETHPVLINLSQALILRVFHHACWVCIVKGQLWLHDAALHLLHHLQAEYSQSIAHIGYLFNYYLFEQRGQFFQGVIVRVINPSADEHTVVRLQLEVLCNVVYYQSAGQVSTNPGQVLFYI